MKKIISLRQALSDRQYFGGQLDGDSWANWRALLLAIAGEPLEPDEMQVFTSLTKRRRAPLAGFAESWLIMGRRSGKSVSLAVLATWLASCFDYRDVLAAGEIAQVLVVSQSRDQAGNLFNLIAGAFAASPALRDMVVYRTADTLSLRSRVDIVVRPANFRSTRGQTAVAILCDEVAYWRSDDSAVPDTEVLRALRPSLLTTGGPLLCISSPYAKRGELWRHFIKYFGKESGHILVANAASTTMNPTLDPAVIAQAYEDDPEAAAAEIGAEFRSDIAAFISREAVEACVSHGIFERLPLSDTEYVGFVDPSGGSADSMTLAIAHRADDFAVVDCIREVRLPFSPESVVDDFCKTLVSYRVTNVCGDRYAGEWAREPFRKRGIGYEPSAKVKSDIYCDMLPLLNSRRVDLLDDKRLIGQLCGLERRTARGGRDSIDHSPGSHDDVANCVAGAACLAIMEPPTITAMTGRWQWAGCAPRGVELRANMEPPPGWKFPATCGTFGD
jgi:hypothetical protein